MCGCTLKPILAALPARSISLASVNGASLSETKVKADLAASLVFAAPAIHPSPSSREVTSVTICRELPAIQIKQLSPNTAGQIRG